MAFLYFVVTMSAFRPVICCAYLLISFAHSHLTYISFFFHLEFRTRLRWAECCSAFDLATSISQTPSARTTPPTMSSYTSEIVVGSAIVAALGVAAYMVVQPLPAQLDESLPSTTSKKQPKKKKSALQDSLQEKLLHSPPAPRLPKPAPVTVPGGFAPLDNDELSAASGSNAGSAKKKKRKLVKKATTTSATATPLGGPTQAGTAATSTEQYLSPEYSAQKSETDEGPWTRVENRRNTSSGAPESASETGVTTSVTEEEGSITGKKEELAEEKLLPPPAETVVDEYVHTPAVLHC